jgi:divalent metal cation (Fe/Co/Zn/Cd) transporter
VTGNGAWDGLGAAAVGTLLIVIAIFLGMEMVSMLTGESALPEEDAAIATAIESTPGFGRVIHMKTLHLGPDEVLVAAKVAVASDSSAAEVARTIDDAEVRIRAAMPGKTCVVYLEPDIYDPQHRPTDISEH